MEQHDAPLAARLGGHERRAVGEPRPGARSQARDRLGQHLPLDGHLLGHGEAGEGRAVGEGREPLRLLPGERAAQRAFAGAQRHRQQPVRVLGHARAGEAHEGAALLDEARECRFLARLGDRPVGHREHGEAARQKRVEGGAPRLGVGRKRALQEEQLAHIGRVGGLLGAGDQPHGAAAEALVEQRDAGRGGALKVEPDHLVAQLERQLQRGAALRGAGRNRNKRAGERAAIGGAREHRGLGGRAQRELPHAEHEPVALGARRREHARGLRLCARDGEPPGLGQRGGEGGAVALGVLDAIGDPEHRERPRIGAAERGEGGRGGCVVRRPGARAQRGETGARFLGRHGHHLFVEQGLHHIAELGIVEFGAKPGAERLERAVQPIQILFASTGFQAVERFR